MSEARPRPADASGACIACLRRGWLLAELGAMLDCNTRADGRLLDVLALGDRQLIAALGGRRRAELLRRHAGFASERRSTADSLQAVCRHDDRYPPRARELDGVAALHVLGGVERLRQLTAQPVVAFVGRARASDYGIALASSIGRGLAAAGVTVASGLLGGVGPAALGGALELGAPAVAVVGGGVDVGAPARQQALHRRLSRSGCAVGELPCGSPARRWTALAAERLLVAFADVALFVESEQSANALVGARVAAALGRTVAAVPGRVTSRGSRGPHALLREGARLVTGPGDLLDLLGDGERPSPALDERGSPRAWEGLDPFLRAVLERVGSGEDTPGRLLGARDDARALLCALGELELMGLLVRGEGARYLVGDPLAAPSPR
ncbi:MAG: processing protein [Solirubrobacteraceae bacterium]|nr:processing protein [Solirubrobacteraceae bacterium]